MGPIPRAAMHDIKLIRDNPQSFDAGLIRRGGEPAASAILALDTERRAVATRMQEAQNRRNEASKAIGAAKARKAHDEAESLMAEVTTLKQTLPALEAEEKALTARLQDELARFPNLPDPDVPEGVDEAGNVEVACWGIPRAFAFTPREHADIGPALGLDFETGAAISGARFTFLRGQMARLQRALGQFMLDKQTVENGYVECAPPLLVRDEAVFGTGQLPKFAEDLFRTSDGRWLIPTAEVSLTNLVREQITPEEELPLRLAALTPCFRSEAGASGKDTRGMIRQHQFYKVELVSITAPEDSDTEHQRMVDCAEAVLKRLDLPFRTVVLSTGDMGFSAKKTYDIEVWLPSQATYREISSCSNCGDFQARRMDARCRRAGEKGARFVHTLNGSGLAVGRTLVALMENYQDERGRIAIPQVLQGYMGGLTHIGGER